MRLQAGCLCDSLGLRDWEQRAEVGGESEIWGLILGALIGGIRGWRVHSPHLSYALHKLVPAISAWATLARLGTQQLLNNNIETVYI